MRSSGWLALAALAALLVYASRQARAFPVALEAGAGRSARGEGDGEQPPAFRPVPRAYRHEGDPSVRH